MFKLRKAGSKGSSNAADRAKPAAKKKLVKSGEKPKPKPTAKGRATKSAAKGKPKLRALPKPHKENALRSKRGARPHDLGIGAHTIEPVAGTPETAGLIAARAAMDKKGTDVVVLDVSEISGLCDEMVIASARSVTHLSAVADSVEEAMRKAGERVVHRDGLAGAEPDWVLLDYGNLMVHIFRPEARQNYGLEAYYAEARLVAKWKND